MFCGKQSIHTKVNENVVIVIMISLDGIIIAYNFLAKSAFLLSKCTLCKYFEIPNMLVAGIIISNRVLHKLRLYISKIVWKKFETC